VSDFTPSVQRVAPAWRKNKLNNRRFALRAMLPVNNEAEGKLGHKPSSKQLVTEVMIMAV